MKYKLITVNGNKDITTIVDVANQSYEEHYLHLWKDNGARYISETISESIFQEWVKNNSNIFLKVVVEDEIVGYIKLNKNRDVNGNHSSNNLELDKIYLIQKFSGKGLGTYCLEEIESIARKLNTKIIWLKVMANNQAVQFYLKNGYAIIGDTKLEHPMVIPEHSSMYVMSKSL